MAGLRSFEELSNKNHLQLNSACFLIPTEHFPFWIPRRGRSLRVAVRGWPPPPEMAWNGQGLRIKPFPLSLFLKDQALSRSRCLKSKID